MLPPVLPACTDTSLLLAQSLALHTTIAAVHSVSQTQDASTAATCAGAAPLHAAPARTDAILSCTLHVAGTAAQDGNAYYISNSRPSHGNDLCWSCTNCTIARCAGAYRRVLAASCAGSLAAGLKGKA